MENKTLLERLGDESISSARLKALYSELTRIPSAPDADFFSVARSLPTASYEGHVASVSGLIVETRPHKNLAFTVALVQRRLGIPILLLHGKLNREFVTGSKRLQKLVAAGKLITRELPVNEFTRSQYNSLFLSREFWESTIPSEQILVFQTDATLCSLSPHRIRLFSAYDYIGSFRRNPRPIGASVNGGNGGLSLRSRAAMLAALDHGFPEMWPGGEDDYFGSHVELIGKRVGDVESQKKFSSQHVFERLSFGVHNPGGIGRVKFLLLLVYCPSAIRCHRGSLLGRRNNVLRKKA